MARTTRLGTNTLYAAAEQWIDRALRRDDSLFTPGATIWAGEHLAELHRRFVEEEQLGARAFLDKLHDQLQGADAPTIQLAAELFFVHLLMPSDTTGATKREQVSRILSWSPAPVTVPTDLDGAFDTGMATVGVARSQVWQQVRYLLEFAQAWKALPGEQREAALNDPWAFKEWLFTLPHRSAYVQREALLHLVHPDTFEPIISRDVKRQIAERLAEYVSDSKGDVDRQLAEIRDGLAPQYGSAFRFYQPEVKALWQPDAPEATDPSPKRVVKIAPGELARFWDDCLAGGYICVGWDAVGDLRRFANKDAFLEEFRRQFLADYNGNTSTVSRKANELWTLRDLEPGDVVVANRGTTEVLAIGEVVAPGYAWSDSRSEYRHTVSVRWDTSYAQQIPKQGAWATVTIAPVSAELFRHILARGSEAEVESSGAWIFQANLKNYDAAGAVAALQELNWTVRKYADRVKPGDTVYVWESGPQAGVVGVATVLTEPGQLPPDPSDAPFEREPQLSTGDFPQVRLRIERALPRRILRQDLLGHPVLKGLGVIKMPQGTNYPLEPAQAEALGELVSSVERRRRGAPQPFREILRAIAARGLFYSPEVVSNYLLALQTKRFVILSGISGTGKTQLAMAVADTFSPGFQAGSAPPATMMPRTAVELRVYPYMLKYHRLVIPEAVASTLRAWQTLESGVGGNSQVQVTYPGGTVSLSLYRNVGKNVLQLGFKGGFRSWFEGTLQVGERFYLDAEESPDGEDGGADRLRVILPGAAAPEPVELAERARVVAVRPDWTDSRGLLGYFNPLTNRYTVTPFLQLLLDADEECARAEREGRAPRPFFAVLDEMNLARVEHYFSDFLSSLESGQPLDLHSSPEVEAGETEDGVAVPRQLRVSPNLFFTGTVNVDETTYMFSPKVLDRAFTIELNQVDLEAFGDQPEVDTPGTLRLEGFPGALVFERAPGAEDWTAFAELEDGKPRRVVVALHRLLGGDQRHFGYRVANEIARFTLLASEESEENPEAVWAALDLAILQKVLPKFHGTQQELEATLERLFAFLVAARAGDGAQGAPGANVDGYELIEGVLRPRGGDGDAPPALPHLPRSAAKVWRMLRRLRQQGFTSFIE